MAEVNVEKFRQSIERIYGRSGGKAFEQKCSNDHILIQWGIKEGYWRLVDGRCGFEMIRDSMLAWTDAAHTAFKT